MNKELLNPIKEVYYVNSMDKFALMNFKIGFEYIFNKVDRKKSEIVILCIGTDRATGDSLGPLIGYKLKKMNFKENIHIYGTLESPVHALNISSTLSYIRNKYREPTIIAIDAALGSSKNIKHISFGLGSIKPGAGLKKELPSVGDIFITGIVNNIGAGDGIILQTTRLADVMHMVDIISSGLFMCLSTL